MIFGEDQAWKKQIKLDDGKVVDWNLTRMSIL